MVKTLEVQLKKLVYVGGGGWRAEGEERRLAGPQQLH